MPSIYMLACVLLIIAGAQLCKNLVNIYNLCISTHTQFYITLSRCVLVIKSSLKCRQLGFYYLANFYRLVAGDVMDIMYRAP